jgi:hypothetical protein
MRDAQKNPRKSPIESARTPSESDVRFARSRYDRLGSREAGPEKARFFSDRPTQRYRSDSAHATANAAYASMFSVTCSAKTGPFSSGASAWTGDVRDTDRSRNARAAGIRKGPKDRSRCRNSRTMFRTARKKPKSFIEPRRSRYGTVWSATDLA